MDIEAPPKMYKNFTLNFLLKMLLGLIYTPLQECVCLHKQPGSVYKMLCNYPQRQVTLFICITKVSTLHRTVFQQWLPICLSNMKGYLIGVSGYFLHLMISTSLISCHICGSEFHNSPSCIQSNTIRIKTIFQNYYFRLLTTLN